MGRFYANDWKIDVPVEELLRHARQKKEYHTARALFWKEQDDGNQEASSGELSAGNCPFDTPSLPDSPD